VLPLRLAAALPLLAFAAPQLIPRSDPSGHGPEPGQSRTDQYGNPETVELASISGDAGPYQRRNVRVRGTAEPLGWQHYLTLRDGGFRVLLIPMDTGVEIERLLGFPVEITGVVRQIRKKQYVGRPPVDLDLVEDPGLPVLPAPDLSLPRVSLTVLSMSDITPLEKRVAPAEIAKNIAADPARYTGKKVTIIGQFRGRNLFGDLPTVSQRNPSDWVLKDGDSALWVTGKSPRGKGWALDPGYKGDTSKWLEVVGRAEVVEGIVYLRASQVVLASAPKPLDADATR
jgi:hypothetical protein